MRNIYAEINDSVIQHNTEIITMICAEIHNDDTKNIKTK